MIFVQHCIVTLGQNSRVSHVLVMSLDSAALEEKFFVWLWVERQWGPLSRECCNRYSEVHKYNTTVMVCVDMYGVYVHVSVSVGMYCSSSHQQFSQMGNGNEKKAPATAFVMHQMWLCIFMLQMSFIFFRTLSAVNRDTSYCYSSALLCHSTVTADNGVF